ncbi:MAG: hypothetical protein RLY57_441 [Candidatus Parcubacteria bacterium]|jgi:hypothetical protein
MEKNEKPIRFFDVNNKGPLTFTVVKNMGRVIMYVPTQNLDAIGGWNGLRSLFSEVFGMPSPIWGEPQRTGFAVELPDDADKIEDFNKLIVERSS